MAVAKSGENQKYELKLVVETVLIIEKIIEAKIGLTLTEVSNRTQITKNKAFRILVTLIQCGILEKDEQSNYRIGSKSIEYARRILAKSSSFYKARLDMENLARSINETVYLAKYDGPEAVLVDCADCCQPIKATSFIGAAIRLQSIAGTTKVAKIGDDITVDADSLSPEITTVSIAYTNEDGCEIGALIVLAPTYRMTPHRIKTVIIPALRNVMQPHLVQLPDRSNEKVVLEFHPSMSEYAKPPYLVAGRSFNSAFTAG